MTTLVKKLSEVQKKLNAPKGQFNSFGKYHYRSCEDILMAVKPLLDGLVLTVNDDMVLVGTRIYVKATATISDGETSISTSAFARESEDKKGMDSAQVTGSTSSYARKYALNGLLLIDDNKDADHLDNSDCQRDFAKEISSAKNNSELKRVWESMNEQQQSKFKDAVNIRKTELSPKEAA